MSALPYIPLLQSRPNQRTFASGVSNLPLGETPLPHDVRGGIFTPNSASAQAGELAGVGQQQCPGLSKAGSKLPPLTGFEPFERRPVTPPWRAIMPRTSARADDRAVLLHANPHVFIEAAVLLERLLPALHAATQGRKVHLAGVIPADLADDLAAWGADLTDLEDGADAEAEGHW
jgi:hypothetical protein